MDPFGQFGDAHSVFFFSVPGIIHIAVKMALIWATQYQIADNMETKNIPSVSQQARPETRRAANRPPRRLCPAAPRRRPFCPPARAGKPHPGTPHPRSCYSPCSPPQPARRTFERGGRGCRMGRKLGIKAHVALATKRGVSRRAMLATYAYRKGSNRPAFFTERAQSPAGGTK